MTFHSRVKKLAAKMKDISFKCLQYIAPRFKKAMKKYIVFSYKAGIYSARTIKRSLVFVFKPVGGFAHKTLDFLFIRHFKILKSECKNIKQGFSIAGSRLKAAWHRNILATIPEFFKISGRAVMRHTKFIGGIFNYALPAAAVTGLVLIVSFWTTASFGLAVEYDGKLIGYIQDESVYDNAADLVSARVIDENSGFELSRTPRYTLSLVSKDDLSSAEILCDTIISNSNELITSATGLYVDGKFFGAVEDQTKVVSLLDSVLAKYRTGDPTETVSFVQEIGYQKGLYPNENLVDFETIEQKLTAKVGRNTYYTAVDGDAPETIAAKNKLSLEQLKALNPALTDLIHVGDQIITSREQDFLTVKVIKQQTHTEDIKYTIEEQTDNKQYTDYRVIKQDGETGTQEITEEVVMINGAEVSRAVTNTLVLKAPVNQIEVVGSMKRPVATRGTYSAASGRASVTGRFMWPVDGGSISSRFGWRWGRMHKALDICASYGTSIFASDGGTVVEVNYSGSGYGLNVVIDHGNGYRTRYAHCSAIYVQVGQNVGKGQTIAAIGSTGFATGPHVHFEVIKNGVEVDPAPYLGV